MRKTLFILALTLTLFGCGAKAYNTELQNALIDASIAGDLEEVKTLIEQGAQINISCPENILCKPLLHAAENGHIELTEYLLNQGADIDAMDGYYGTALMYALNREQMEVAYFLIDQGANLNLASEKWLTPLAVAIGMEDRQLYDYVIDKTDIHQRFFEDVTYIMVVAGVATPENEELMMYFLNDLLERGADPSLLNTYGESALDFVYRKAGGVDSESVPNRIVDILSE